MPGPISDTMPSLPERMRALASRGHPRAVDLRAHADALDRATTEWVSAPQVLGAWARARRVWSECSGEPLID